MNARVLLVLALTLVGCFGGLDDDPILMLSSTEALEEGRGLLAQDKPKEARPYFLHAFEVEPNSATGREGLLLASDSFFRSGGEANLIKAEARYRDFVNRFPTSEHAAYAQFQIGLSLARRVVKPDRDQSVSEQALVALDDVRRFYPTSTYAEQATVEMALVRNRIAEHDYLVGRFYIRFGMPYSAIQRFEGILENYADYPDQDKVLFQLCRAHVKRGAPGDAALASGYCGRLERDFPESEFAGKISKPPPLPIEELEVDEEDDTSSESADTGV